MKTEVIVKLLESKDIQASYQRMKILEYLINHRTHPTVDTIYCALAGKIPTLSKTTIYNTLKIFVDKNIVSQVTVEENESRYDYSETSHLHFKCKNCGKLYDIFQVCDLLNQREIEGHKIDEYHLNFRGICKECKKGVSSNG